MSIVRFYWGGALHAPARYALDREQKEFLKNQTFYGSELVPTTFKLCLMNLYLHNIGDIYGNVPVTLGDALLTDPGYRVDYVLTNPPFGKKSSITFTNEEGEQEEEAAGDLRPAYDPAPAHWDFYKPGVKANVIFFDSAPPARNGRRKRCGCTISEPTFISR